MSDELLNRATRALRTAAPPRRDDLEIELAKLMTQRSRLSRVSRRTRGILWGIAATFVCVGAWANATGKLGALRQLAQETFVTRRAASARPTPPRTSPQRTPELEQAISDSAQAAPTAEPTSNTAGSPAGPGEQDPLQAPTTPNRSPSSSAKAHAMHARGPGDGAPVASPEPELPAPTADDLYRAAHRAHFAGSNPQAALAAWDRYLAAAGPGARFLLEARYNRAIVLVQLGRASEARAALQPFANGEYGGYRRDEARALLDSLAAKTP